MKLILPVKTTEATLTATNVLENDYPIWAAGTTYARGALVMSTTTHTVYRSLVSGNVGTNPDLEAIAFADPLIISDGVRQWQVVRATNRWLMFDERPSQQTTRADSIEVTITPGTIVGGLAGFEIDATSVDILVTSPGLARRNLMTYSEQLDHPNWAKYLTAITPNTHPNSQGQMTADTIAATADDWYVSVVQAFGFEAGLYTLQFEAQAGTTEFLHGTIQLSSLEILRFHANLLTGEVQVANGAGTIAGAIASVMLSGGMWLISLQFDVAEPGSYTVFLGPCDGYGSYSVLNGQSIVATRFQINKGSKEDYQWITNVSTWDRTVMYRSIEMLDNSNVVDWYTYFFEPLIPLTEFTLTDLPPYGDAVITVTINKPGDIAACGQLILGTVRPFGIGVVAPGSGFEGYDLSYVEVNEFGDRTTVKRPAARISRFEVLMDNDTLSGLDGLFRTLRGGTPAVWIGDDDVSRAAVNYGFYRGYTVGYRNKYESMITLQIMGIT